MLGRPKSSDPKNESVEFRLTQGQKQKLKDLSESHGTSISSWILDRSLTESSVETLFCSGVYLLLNSGSVVYVGQSKCCGLRLSTHWYSKTKNFDSFIIIPCHQKHLKEREEWLIKALNPPLNNQRIESDGLAYVRLPAELKAKLEEQARINSRTLTGEILHRLKQSLENPKA